MYGDLLNQIIKYMKPVERYYLFLEIYINESTVDAYFFYLVYELNGEIKIKQKLGCIYLLGHQIRDVGIHIFSNKDFSSSYDSENEYLIMKVICSRKCVFIDNVPNICISKKKKELKIIEYDNLNDEIIQNKDPIVNFTTKEGRTVNIKIDTYKINNRSIDFIMQGIKTFRRICAIGNLIEEDLSERDKKYVKIVKILTH